MKNNQIPKLIKKLIDTYDTNNPFEICKLLDIVVLYVPLNGLNGFYTSVDKVHYIYISEDLNEDEQKFICAHELCHAILHSGLNSLYIENNSFMLIQKFENEADLFAFSLLYSKNHFNKLLHYYNTDDIADKIGIHKNIINKRIEMGI